jgi:transposase
MADKRAKDNLHPNTFYIGLAKTHLQQVATATAINVLRTINFLNDVPRAKTRISRFARLDY